MRIASTHLAENSDIFRSSSARNFNAEQYLILQTSYTVNYLIILRVGTPRKAMQHEIYALSKGVTLRGMRYLPVKCDNFRFTLEELALS
jgi:hypothetical protein